MEELVPIDAVLVLDVSRSMITADPNRIANQAMNMFIDRLELGRDRVGIVAYAGYVTYSSGLISLYEESRSHLQNTIYALDYASWTDHPLGLLEAIDILLEDNDEYRQSIIIFLTDGNLNVNPHGTRTTADAEYDKAQVISLAQEYGIPIFAIGLNFDGLLDRKYTEIVANETGGIAFETYDAHDLIYILETIFSLLQYIQIFNEPAETIEIITYNPIHQKNVTLLEYKIYDNEKNSRTPIIAGTAAVFLLSLLLIKARKQKRVFTGRLTIQIVKPGILTETRNFNLIEYGRQVSLDKLLSTFPNKTPAEFGKIIITPCPNAPSHLPQLMLVAPKSKVQIAVNFLAGEELRRVRITPGSDIKLFLEDDTIEINMQYL